MHILIFTCLDVILSIEGLRVPVDYHTIKVDVAKTKIVMLIPSWRGLGLCAFAVTHKLTEIHNDFMEQYTKLRHIG